MQEVVVKNEWQKRALIEQIVTMTIDRPMVFIWKQWRQKRSRDANALLHVWLGEISEHSAFDNTRKSVKKQDLIELIKDRLKERFLGNETVEYVDQRTGEILTITRLRRTRDLDSGEFCFFLEQIQEWALHGLGMVLTSNKEDEFSQWQERQHAA